MSFNFPAPPSSRSASLGSMSNDDGTDLFRLMSKANKYSSASSNRKQGKSQNYASMAGAMLKKHGIQDEKYSSYTHAYEMARTQGGGKDPDAQLGDFQSGKMAQIRHKRREAKSRLESHPANDNKEKGRSGYEREFLLLSCFLRMLCFLT
jgi:hypothetical protein